MQNEFSCPVPIEQRPTEEFKQLVNSWFFSWPNREYTNLLKPLFISLILIFPIFLTIEISDLANSINQAVRISDQVEHKTTIVEERSIQDGKRIADFKGDLNNLRTLLDEMRLKLESIEDTNLSNHNYINDLLTMENNRQLEQSQWIEQQTVASSERERWWLELQKQSKEIETSMQESALLLEEFKETLHKLKNRGQDSCGISYIENGTHNVINERTFDLLSEKIKNKRWQRYNKKTGCIHS